MIPQLFSLHYSCSIFNAHLENHQRTTEMILSHEFISGNLLKQQSQFSVSYCNQSSTGFEDRTASFDSSQILQQNTVYLPPLFIFYQNTTFLHSISLICSYYLLSFSPIRIQTIRSRMAGVLSMDSLLNSNKQHNAWHIVHAD